MIRWFAWGFFRTMAEDYGRGTKDGEWPTRRLARREKARVVDNFFASLAVVEAEVKRLKTENVELTKEREILRGQVDRLLELVKGRLTRIVTRRR